MHRAHSRSSITRDQSGTISILAAAILPVSVAVTALAVDVASLYLERRTIQGVADLASLAAASNLDSAESAARETLEANGVANVKQLVVTKGHYSADPAIAYQQRFQPGEAPYNAVKVEVVRASNLYFARMFNLAAMDEKVTSVGAATAEASFSVGSRLAAVRGGVLNALLGGLVGGSLSLSVMDYNALLDARVSIGDYLGALATELNLRAGTYNDVLASSARISNVINALIAVNERNGASSAVAALKAAQVASSVANLQVPLDHLFNLGPYGSLQTGSMNPGLGATIDALSLLQASAALANGGHQVSVDLTANVPGIAKLTLDLVIGEPMQYSGWVSVGSAGATLRTAQTKLRLTAQIGGQGLLSGITVTLPIYAEAAYAEARLSAVTCRGSGVDQQATIAVTPGVARTAIASVTDRMLADPQLWQKLPKGQIVSTSLLKVNGSAVVNIGNVGETLLRFDDADVAAHTIKRADTSDYLTSLVTSLLQQLQLEVAIGGLSLTTPAALTSAVATQLAVFTKPLDAVLYDVLSTLGVHLGEADVQVHGIRCGTPALAG